MCTYYAEGAAVSVVAIDRVLLVVTVERILTTNDTIWSKKREIIKGK